LIRFDSSFMSERDAAAAFLADFRVQCAGIKGKMEGEKQELGNLEEYMKDIEGQVEAIRGQFNEMAIILTPYDTQKCMEEIKMLLDMSIQFRADHNPQKKFSFKSKKKTTSQPQSSDANSNSSNANTIVNGHSNISSSNSQATILLQNAAIFENKENAQLHPGKEEVEGKDLELNNLKNSKVFIKYYISAARITNIKDSIIVLGPVAGSVFIEDCQNSKFILACHQLRIHGSKEIQFYLHVTSKPIIEDCDSLLFAPYSPFSYPTLEEDFKLAKLNPEVNEWEDVEDFNWLKKTKSPHWSVQPESERQWLASLS